MSVLQNCMGPPSSSSGTHTYVPHVGDEVTPMYDVHGVCGVTRAM